MADEISYETFYEILQKGGWSREGVTVEEEQAAIARRAGERMDRMPSPDPDDPDDPMMDPQSGRPPFLPRSGAR